MKTIEIKSKKFKTNTSVLVPCNEDFDFPDVLLNEIINNNVVIFAGAGISTERKHAFDISFYDDICGGLDINPKNSSLSFSEVMSRFVEETNGKKELLNAILSRIECAKDFPEIGNKVTEFHNLLSHIPFIQDIVTTNWDNFFEEYCDALPIVQDKDFVFSNYKNKRKVYKIHGSISSPSTIIATKEDYDKCYADLNYGVLGGHLKSLLATKTIIFVGFSFGDEDLERIFKMLKNNIGDFLPCSYIVNLDDKFDPNIYPNSIHIKSDACFFVKKILNNLIDNKHLCASPDVYDYIFATLQRFRKEHEKIADLYVAKKKLRHRIMHCLIFQDGVMHAFQRALKHASTGKYLLETYLLSSLNTYSSFADKLLKEEGYFDFSYVEGYAAGLSMILCSQNVSFYYIPGHGKHIKSINKFKKLLLNNLNSKIELYSKNYIKELKVDESLGYVVHHPPFL